MWQNKIETVATQFGKYPMRRNIVKKIVSILLVLVVLVTMFAVTTVAFAEEQRTVTFVSEEFWKLDDVKNVGKLHAIGNFQLNNEWLKNPETVKKVFTGISYTLKTPDADEKEENKKEFEVATGSDVISVEYCTPSRDYKEDWSTTSLDNKISVSSTGWWAFRYVVKDSSGKVLGRSDRIDIYFNDEKKPEITSLHSDMTKAAKEGIKVGDTYTIKTNINISDSSSTTVSYVVYKWEKGAWTSEPIFDSTTMKIKDGYTGISSNGIITMTSADVLPNNAPVYKIVYTVTDRNGYESEHKDENDLLLFAKTGTNRLSDSEIWSIVLYVIAGLSAVGIVAILFIKPKNAAQPESSKKTDGENKQ